MLINALKTKWTYNTFINTYPEYKELCTPSNFKDWRAVTLAKAVHGDKYDYSLWVGIKNKTSRVTSICSIHGEFTQEFRKHVTGGHGCKQCAVAATRMSLGEFKTKATAVHGGNYTYGKIIKLEGIVAPVLITCKEHGDFIQDAYSHLEGHKCPTCANRKRLTLEEVQEQLKGRDFKVLSYTNGSTHMILECPKHGTWGAYKTNVLGRESGCPKCALGKSTSKAETYIDNFISSLGLETEKYIMKNGKHIDIFIPELNIGFEYNGSYWHCDANKERTYHIDKTTQAEKEGIELIHIWEYEYSKSPEIVLNMVRSKLGKSTKRVYARKCAVDLKVSPEEAKEFSDKHHIQGHRPSTTYVGLRHKGDLVMLASFMNTRGASSHNCDIELIRLVSSTNVVGGASRLLSKMSKHRILSYARRDYSKGLVYEALGFDLVNLTTPNYKYIRQNKITPRQACMKHKLPALLGDKIDMTKTEKQLMTEAGYNRIYDCGNLVYIKEAL